VKGRGEKNFPVRNVKERASKKKSPSAASRFYGKRTRGEILDDHLSARGRNGTKYAEKIGVPCGEGRTPFDSERQEASASAKKNIVSVVPRRDPIFYAGRRR